jgi:hypothetical protein
MPKLPKIAEIGKPLTIVATEECRRRSGNRISGDREAFTIKDASDTREDQ